MKKGGAKVRKGAEQKSLSQKHIPNLYVDKTFKCMPHDYSLDSKEPSSHGH